jgi:hypothetical protein
VTASWDNGVVARVPLPDGSMFVAAGRLDTSTGQPPDAGASGNIAGFCAALSG